MIHKKLLSLLVLLMTAASGAWADEATITLKCGTTEKTYENVTLPWSTTADILKAVVTDLNFNVNINAISGGDGKVVKYGNENFTVTGTFSGDATVTVTYNMGSSATITVTAPRPLMTLSDDGKTATMESMPAFDATVNYELVRDMSVSVSAAMANRVRIQEVENKFQPIVATQINPEVKDNLNTQSPVTMTVTTDYSLQLQKKGANDEWTDVTDLSVGTFRYMVVGNGLYDGIAYTNEFQLFEGYSVEVPAGEYATFYAEDKVKIDESTTGGQLYTITSVNVTDAKATATELTVAAAQTPLLVYNTGSEKKTFLLIPTEDAATSVTAASQFKGTTTATTIAASTSTLNNYAFNGKQFVWVKNALSVAANKCWLEIGTVPAGTRSISIVFGDGTTGIEAIDNGQLTIDNWYDLNGRRLQGKPTKKGVYIQNGKKVVVK